MTTVDALSDRIIGRERAALYEEARRVPDHIADTPPSETKTTSGEVTRLYDTELLRLTAKLETAIKAAQPMKDQPTTH
ncbi:hypothetical protein [Streptomyces erythrochromogenes]|uniref:hypothetical protein n=1 Tax=Streptomyces erythrochromogenes TaxID=285574 RepID=UPI0033D67D1F